MNNKFLAIILLCGLSTAAPATEPEALTASTGNRSASDSFVRRNGLGIACSSISGVGLCWTHRWTEHGTSKLTGIVASRDEKQGTDSFYSFGVEYQMDIISRSGKNWHNSRYRFFWFAGGGWWNERFDEDRDYDPGDRHQQITAGLGVGFAVHVDHRLVFEFTGGLQLAEEFDSDNDYTGTGLGAAMIVLF